MKKIAKRIAAAFSGVKAPKLDPMKAVEDLERLITGREGKRREVQAHETDAWIEGRLRARPS